MGSSWPYEGMKGQIAGAEGNVARVVGTATKTQCLLSNAAGCVWRGWGEEHEGAS